jgi:hypothetical protein
VEARAGKRRAPIGSTWPRVLEFTRPLVVDRQIKSFVTRTFIASFRPGPISV